MGMRLSDNYEHGLRWLLARSDVEAAAAYIDRFLIEKEPELKLYLRHYWPQLFDGDEYQRVYREAGVIEAQVDCFAAIPHTMRYQTVAQAYNYLQRPPRVLDFGCSRAFHSIHLHNQFGGEYTCVDIDQRSVDEANQAIQQYARYPGNMRALVATDLGGVGCDYDLVMCMETLEHVLNYRDLVSQFEQAAKPGCWILLTLPHGPVEYTMWVESPSRNREHLREFTVQDCYDLWGRKPGFSLNLFASKWNQYALMHEGSILITYRADRAPCGEINMHRKLFSAAAEIGPALPDHDGILIKGDK
jgi:hypothetical protein